VSKRIGSYPRVRTGAGSAAVVSQAGAVLLVETIRKAGLDAALSAALAPWRNRVRRRPKGGTTRSSTLGTR